MNSKEKTITELRRDLLKIRLGNLNGVSVYCKDIKKEILITNESIKETAFHASKSTKSTNCALHLKEALENALFVKDLEPKDNKQKKVFYFKKVYELSSHIDGIGDAKIIIGENKKGMILHYCITSKK